MIVQLLCCSRGAGPPGQVSATLLTRPWRLLRLPHVTGARKTAAFPIEKEQQAIEQHQAGLPHHGRRRWGRSLGHGRCQSREHLMAGLLLEGSGNALLLAPLGGQGGLQPALTAQAPQGLGAKKHHKPLQEVRLLSAWSSCTSRKPWATERAWPSYSRQQLPLVRMPQRGRPTRAVQRPWRPLATAGGPGPGPD